MADSTLAHDVADLADIGLLKIDGAQVIRQANVSAHRLLGRQVGELIGRTVLEAFLDHRVSDLLAGAARDGHARRELGLGGEPQRSMLVIATRHAAGETWMVLRDLSELRRLQRIRTEFVDNLSHELRTPVTNLRLLAETLALELERGLDTSPRIRDSVERIDVETGRLATMVTELLDLARIEQGNAQLRRARVDLRVAVDGVIGRLKPYADRQDVTLVVQPADLSADPVVMGDEERLEQMLVNVVQNAIKFSPPHTEVAVSLSEHPESANSIVVKVEDRGPGIPRRDLERIFERFYKVDRARTRGGEAGTGLGLAIARHIAEAHGGRIWAESGEGQGADFFISLPRA